jgi:dTDP-4-amino-4,6-dideoxygalactose transaminase
VLDVKLKYLDEDNAHRQQIAKMYYDGIKKPQISLPERLPDAQNVYHLFPILVADGKRDELQAYLKENGVGTLIHYPIPPHKQECYASAPWNIGLQLPVTEQIAAQELSLPIGPTIKRETVSYIIEVINRFQK